MAKSRLQPEPEDVKDIVERGEMGVRWLHGQTVLFIPRRMSTRVSRERLVRLTYIAYGKKTIENFRITWDIWASSTSIVLPPRPQGGRPESSDERLDKFKRLILAAVM